MVDFIVFLIILINMYALNQNRLILDTAVIKKIFHLKKKTTKDLCTNKKVTKKQPQLKNLEDEDIRKR